MAYAIATTMSLTVGFLSGLLTFKRADRWCPTCGDDLRCQAGHPARRIDGPAR